MEQDKSYTPFYSEVIPEIQEELRFRAECGISDKRTDEQLEWMNSRTSWGSISILELNDDGSVGNVAAAINNESLSVDNNPTVEGTFFRGTKGIIKDVSNRWNAGKNQITNFGQGVRSYDATDPENLAKNYINYVSGRPPGPVLQQIQFTLVDTKDGFQGLLNDAEVKILIPDIEYFITEFEPTWFKMLARCVIEIGHSVRLDRKPNYARYVGQISSFDFKYESDGSVSATISLKTPTDLISNIGASTSETENSPVEGTEYASLDSGTYHCKLEKYAKQFFKDTTNNTYHVFEPSFIENDYNLNIKTGGSDNSIASLEAELRDKLSGKKFRLKPPKDSDNKSTTYDIFMANIEKDDGNFQYYVSLGMICKLISAEILVATKHANMQRNKSFNSIVDTNLDLIENDPTGMFAAKGGIFPDGSGTDAFGNIQSTNFTRLSPTIITIAPEICQSLYFEELVSADHSKVILPGSEKFPSDLYFSSKYFKAANKAGDPETDSARVIDDQRRDGQDIYYGRLDSWTEDTITRGRDNLDNITFYSDLKSLSSKRRRQLRKFIRPWLDETKELEEDLATDSNNKVFGSPANILISLEALRDIENKLGEVYGQTYNIDIFIAAICNMIRDVTGNAIDLQLTTLPSSEVPSVDETDIQFLIFRDANAVETDPKTNVTEIPMFVNKPIRAYDSNGNQIGRTGFQRLGTVVRDFEIKSKIPDDYKALSITFSQESEVRTGFFKHFFAWTQLKDSPKRKKRLENEYSSAYNTNLSLLQASKIRYSQQPAVKDVKNNLKFALRKYFSTPKKDLESLFKFAAPVWTVEVSLTLDGTYGFRFGDIINVNGLPGKYEQFVFTIMKTDHILVKNDWTTKLDCQMRVRIDPPGSNKFGINKLLPNINVSNI